MIFRESWKAFVTKLVGVLLGGRGEGFTSITKFSNLGIYIRKKNFKNERKIKGKNVKGEGKREKKEKINEGEKKENRKVKKKKMGGSERKKKKNDRNRINYYLSMKYLVQFF